MSRIYVSTYHKYNCGSLKGQWLNLSDYSSRDEFMEACRALHADEDDPELMFQDWEDIPGGLIGESSLDERIWEWLDLDDEEKEVAADYMENVDHLASIAAAIESYDGMHESPEDWAQEYWQQTGMVDQIPDTLKAYIDYEQFARDAKLGGDMIFVDKGYRVRAFRRN